MDEKKWFYGLPLNESITIDYDIDRMVAAPEWKERASFLSHVLGKRRYDLTIDLGAGVGEVSLWAAQYSNHVVAFDLSLTHCLLYSFLMWHRSIKNAYVFYGTLDIFGGKYTPEPVDLIISYNGLTRKDIVRKCPHLGKYIKPNGLFLVVFPRLFFGEDDTSEESKTLANFIVYKGEKDVFHMAPDMRLEASGIACKESDSLPFMSMMCEAPELYDFERKKPTPSWKGASEIELELEYRLYKKNTELTESL